MAVRLKNFAAGLAGVVTGFALVAGAAPAFAYAAPAADGVLDELPAHPPAGTCYARVKVLAEAGPPPGPRAVWRQSPALPGAVGPTWCLVLEPGQAAPPPPERFGWVKVLCDTDATPTRIRKIQKNLAARGDYAGPESGRYDQATAEAVARFQRGQNIDHGGYLSVQTVDAIERFEARPYAAQSYAPAAPPPLYVSGCCNTPPPPPPPPPPVQVRVPVPVPYPVEVRVPVRVEVPVPYRVEVRVPYPVEVRVPVQVPAPYPVYVPVQAPSCCAAPPPPCCASPGYGYPQGYGAPYPPPQAPPQTMGRDRNGWLSWPGKSTY